MKNTGKQGANTEAERWRDAGAFHAAVQSWATRLRVPQPTIRFQAGMTRVWATMDTENHVLSVDAEILTLPKPLGEYLIVHELIHLLVPQAKHGPLFTLLLDCHLPDWQERENQLQRYAHRTMC